MASVLAIIVAAAGIVTSWLGVSLGESAKDVRAQLGKPARVIPSSVGDLWRYDIDNGNATLELVMNQDQVWNIAARVKDGKQSTLADPLGGALGMTADALQKMRGTPLEVYDNGAHLSYGERTGVRWFYTLDGGVVTGIEVSRPLPAASPPQVVSDLYHDGSTLAKAFVVKAATESASASAELQYLNAQSCDASGATWVVSGAIIVPASGRFYRLYHVVCATNKQPRDFYFDVTDSYGK